MKKNYDLDQSAYMAPEHPPTFFFYDLETSGLNSREDRIMQFAGQRTTFDTLAPIGEPINLLVKLSDDTLPSPDAIMVTKITPQSTLQDGLTEAEISKYLQEEVFIPNTVAMGYNSVRFDDEFMRHLFWRNFYDPYEWQWKDGRSKWDLLDVVRLTRALRPEGINWPFNADGKATNRLELLTKLNHISHTHAHDALSDVFALIEVTKLIKEKQPQLFHYLFDIRQKNQVKKLVNLEQKRPFVYASGRYAPEYNKTTVAFPLTSSRNGNILVFDLRHNLDELLKNQELEKHHYYPIVKELCYNKCPAVAPLGVLEKDDGWEKIGLDKQTVEKHLEILLSHPDFAERLRLAYENRPEFPKPLDSESALYEGFLNDRDKTRVEAVRSADVNRLADFHPEFDDSRLADLLVHYKARNYPTTLTESEQQSWEKYRLERLNRSAEKFLLALKRLSQAENSDRYICEELELWYQSLQGADY